MFGQQIIALQERERERVEADRVTSRFDAIPSLAIHTIPPAGTLPGIVSTDNTLTDDLPFTRALFTASTYALMHPRGWMEGKSKGEERER